MNPKETIKVQRAANKLKNRFIQDSTELEGLIEQYSKLREQIEKARLKFGKKYTTRTKTIRTAKLDDQTTTSAISTSFYAIRKAIAGNYLDDLIDDICRDMNDADYVFLGLEPNWANDSTDLLFLFEKTRRE